VDRTSTTGSFNRWRNGYGGRREEPEGTTFFDERTLEDEKALTYTTATLPEELVLIGYPVVHLWVTSTHSDGDLFVYLEEVDAEGRSHYVTEGALRASYRSSSSPPYENFGIPYHRSYQEDLADLPDEPVELEFDLLGTAIVIDAGHRIRVTVTGADADNHELYPDPAGGAPTISIHRDPSHQSFIELPHFAPQ
jgi:putative CocE/NonD family hydrolase